MDETEADSIATKSAHSKFAARLFVVACLLGLFLGFATYAPFGVGNTIMLVAATSQFWIPLLFASYAIGNRGVSPKLLGVYVLAEVIALMAEWIASGRAGR